MSRDDLEVGAAADLRRAERDPTLARWVARLPDVRSIGGQRAWSPVAQSLARPRARLDEATSMFRALRALDSLESGALAMGVVARPTRGLAWVLVVVIAIAAVVGTVFGWVAVAVVGAGLLGVGAVLEIAVRIERRRLRAKRATNDDGLEAEVGHEPEEEETAEDEGDDHDPGWPVPE